MTRTCTNPTGRVRGFTNNSTELMEEPGFKLTLTVKILPGIPARQRQNSKTRGRLIILEMMNAISAADLSGSDCDLEGTG